MSVFAGAKTVFAQAKVKATSFAARHKTTCIMTVSPLAMVAATGVRAFAEEPAVVAASDPLSNVVITSDMLTPLLDGISANIGVILPVGVAILSLIIGIGLLPKVIKMFRS